MSDLVERLRTLVILDEVRSDNPLGREAAARIEALEAALRTALGELAACAVQMNARPDGSIALAIKSARAALAAEPGHE